MQTKSRSVPKSIAVLIVLAISIAASLAGQSREETTIQTFSLDAKGKPAAVTVKYLNLPWGEKSFSYIEKGDDNYYGTRSWPFARFIVAVPVKLDEHELVPGNYALVLNPAKKGQPMAFTVVQLTTNAEFLQAGNVFIEVPAGKTIFSNAATFETSDKVLADHMKITLEQSDKGASLNVLYGNRKLIRTLLIEQ